MKRRWIYMAVLVGLLTLAVTGGVAAAHNGGGGNGPGDGGRDAVTARAAEILGIDQGTLDDALKQARQEVMTGRMQARLDRMVENELITQEQADEYMTWMQDRPEGFGPGFGKGGHGSGGMKHGGGPGRHAQADPAPAPTSLNDSV